MYAVIATGGKQYRVSDGQTLKLETLPGKVGETIEFDKVLMMVDGEKITIGSPYISGLKVKGEVVSHGRGEKIHIIKFRRRKHHMKQAGHRQNYTEVRINFGAGSPPKEAKVKAAASTKTASKKKPKTQSKKAASAKKSASGE